MGQQMHDIGYTRIAYHVRLYALTLFTVFQIAIGLIAFLMYCVVVDNNIVLSEYIMIAIIITLIITETLLGVYTLIMLALPFKLICNVLSRNPKLDKLDHTSALCVKICPPYVKAELVKLDSLLSSDVRRLNHEWLDLNRSSNTTLEDNVLSVLPVGIIVLNSNLNIVYSNSLAPIKSIGNSLMVQLDFSNAAISLQDWLAKAQAEQIYGQKIWTHIANVHPGDIEDRRIYDVIAQYQRGSVNGMDITIITIDRTDKYATEESTMDLLTLAAHELRSPITTMRGYIDLLRDSKGSQRHDLINLIDVSSQRLSSYVNNILNVSRYDRHSLELNPQAITIYDVLDDIREDLSLRAAISRRKLSWDINKNLPKIFADRSSIGEVISNLVDNAIKYTKDIGEIRVTAKVDSDFLAVSIHDNGIGIAPGAMQNLFGKFYRSERSRQAIGGSGLGLYISRAIIKQHGGFIAADSTVGKGATFTIWIPLFKADRINNASDDNSRLRSTPIAIMHNHNKVIQ